MQGRRNRGKGRASFHPDFGQKAKPVALNGLLLLLALLQIYSSTYGPAQSAAWCHAEKTQKLATIFRVHILLGF